MPSACQELRICLVQYASQEAKIFQETRLSHEPRSITSNEGRAGKSTVRRETEMGFKATR